VDDDAADLGDEEATDPGLTADAPTRVEPAPSAPPRKPQVLARPIQEKRPLPPLPPPARVQLPEAPPERKLRLPMPGEMPRGASTPPAASSRPPVDDAPSKPAPASQDAGFMSSELVEKLSAPAEKPKAKSSWRDYREVIRTVVISVFLLAIAVTYKVLTREPAQDAPPPTPPEAQKKSPLQRLSEKPAHPPAETKAAPPPANVAQPANPTAANPAQASTTPPPNAQTAAANNAQAEAAEPSGPTKTNTPMLTIFTSPPGAMIEIDGILYGKTPLVMASPVQTSALKVKLSLDGFKKFEELVTPNETGHYSINVSLKPNR
jgi:hypothetical protein